MCLVRKPLQPLENTSEPKESKSNNVFIEMDKRIDELKGVMLESVGEAVKEATNMASERIDALKKSMEGSLIVLQERVDAQPLEGIAATCSEVRSLQASMQTQLEKVESELRLCKQVLPAKHGKLTQFNNTCE